MSQAIFDPADITLDGLNLTSKTYILTFQTLSFGECCFKPCDNAEALIVRVKVSMLYSYHYPHIFSCQCTLHVLVSENTEIFVRKRGLDTRANIVLLCAIFTPFIVSAVYWVITLVEQIVRIRTLFVDRALRGSHNITSYSTLFNALVFINVSFSIL